VNESEAAGRRIVIDVDGSAALDPDFRQVRCVIRRVVSIEGGYHLLVVHPAKGIRFSDDFVVEDMLLEGIDMDLLAELFGVPQRPEDLPVLVAIWRANDLDGVLRRVMVGKAPGPSEEFLGRGKVRLEE